MRYLDRPFVATALAAALTAFLAAGCTVGPDYVRPVTPAEEADTFVHAPEGTAADSATETDVAPWWRTLGDPQTAELVETALEANTDLRAAAARVLEARSGLRQARARRLPEVGAGVGGSRQRNSFVLPQVGRVTPEATTFSDSLTVAYQADLFGGLRRGQQAAWADLLAQEAARETVVHTVVSEVVRARVRLATLDEALTIARGIRDSWRDTADLVEGRYQRGIAGALEVRLARENLAAAEATVVARERDLDQARLALDVLLGRRPGTGDVQAAGLAPLPGLDAVPLGLPAVLLERRPDVRAAEMRLAAATARVGVALADLFPGLTLNGSAGNSSDVVSDLLSSDTFVFSIVANLAGTLFDGGRRRAAVEGARARAEGATAEYAGTVLTALREVEDALVREATWRRQLTFLEKRLVEARAADAIARSRYRRGVEELLGVLETERRLRAAEDSLTGARSALWNARIDLHLALGGDWGTAPPAQSSRARQDPTGEEASKRQESSKRQHGTHTLPELDKTPTENF